jgi:hypothetical protein
MSWSLPRRTVLTLAIALFASACPEDSPHPMATAPSSIEGGNANAAAPAAPHGMAAAPVVAQPASPSAAPPLDAVHLDMAGHPCRCGGECHCGHCAGMIAGCHCKPKRADGK